MNCEHGEVEFDPQAWRADDPPAWLVALRVRCTLCKEQFHWRGIASGGFNPDEPVVSADGYELRAPIAPGPGAVVGLLTHVGLADRLVAEHQDD